MSLSANSPKVLMVADEHTMTEVLPLFGALGPIRLWLASEKTDLAAQLTLASPDVLIVGHTIGLEALNVLADKPLTVPAPRTLYLGRASDLSCFPECLAPHTTSAPWPDKRELARSWIMRQCARRSAGPIMSSKSVIRTGPLSLDLHRCTATHAETPVALTAAEASLLAALMHNAGRVVSRTCLAEASLTSTSDPKQRRLDAHISNLRRKLSAAAGSCSDHFRIRSHRGRGYILTVDESAALVK